ncbi:MAG: DUF2029 domain-containing protein [Chloroflexi bacterium]|nr:MAG: DUF2029 domain-containing protein [Chloroflexota bacterium]
MNRTTVISPLNGAAGPRMMAMRLAAERVLTDWRLLWAVVALVSGARLLSELSVFWPVGGDAFLYLQGGRQALADPSHLYSNVAALIAKGFTWTVTWPPPQVWLSIPFSLLPEQIGVWAWTLTNGLFVAAGLVLLFRSIGSTQVWALPAFILVCLCFTPLFEEVRLGQRSGLLLLTAVAAMLVVESRPRLAGALVGLGASLKFYPAALLLSVDPRRWKRFTATLIAVAALVLLVSFIPFGSPIEYVMNVLLPVAVGSSVATHDCFQNSTPLLFSRLIGGQSFSVVNAYGVWRDVTIGTWHLTWLATLLAYVTRALVVVTTIWASWRSGWSQPFSMAMAFSLGALIPGDVYTYQFLCVLPLATVLVLKGIERHQWVSVAVAAGCMWFFISSPCALVFPSLWTIASLGLFAVGLRNAARYRRNS